MILLKLKRALQIPKCALCKRPLSEKETDLCTTCRTQGPDFIVSKKKISYVAGWTAVWYYKDKVRGSILRYKFGGKRHYAHAYGRQLAMKLQKDGLDTFDVLTFVPIAPLRKLTRGYDQVELLTNAVGAELGITPYRTLRKIRNTPPQSGIKDPARRRANILGAYVASDPQLVRGKKILLLDDIITTGATASECARVLLTAGAKEVYCAALAVKNPKKYR